LFFVELVDVELVDVELVDVEAESEKKKYDL
jgi:hypothetical protein